jgi:transglycosylase-like protein with SLT domain
VSSFRESISAFGPHKHKIAVSTASAAALACAVFGATVGQTPAARAATGSPATAVNRAVPPKTTHPQTPAAPTATASASASPSGLAASPIAWDKAKKAAPATTSAPAAPATTTTKAAPVATTAADNAYAGLSAYQTAQEIVPADQFAAFAWIITRESGWDVTATNPSSGAYGLGQALPARKMAAYGPDYLTDAATQIKWALAYMDGRYGSPNSAQAFWESHGWY